MTDIFEKYCIPKLEKLMDDKVSCVRITLAQLVTKHIKNDGKILYKLLKNSLKKIKFMIKKIGHFKNNEVIQ